MRYIDLKVISSDIIHIKGLSYNPVPITSGSVNDIVCRFDFSEHWDGLTFKTAVFSGSGTSRSVIIENNEAVVPWECLAKHGGELKVGVVGTSANDEQEKNYRIFTSEEICVGRIVYGADIEVSPTQKPSPDFAEQLFLKFEWVTQGESQRVENENLRKEAEELRVIAESERVAAEEERKANESTRQTNEEQRKANENQRKYNESQRNEKISKLDDRITTLEEKSESSPEISSGTPGNMVYFDGAGNLADSKLALNNITKRESFITHTSNTVFNSDGTHGLRVHNNILQIKRVGEWQNFIDPSQIGSGSGSSSSTPSFNVDPVFANNSWETIANVARYGDPSKYWTVGEFKDVILPIYNFTFDEIHDINNFNRDRFLEFVNYKAGTYQLAFVADDEGFFMPEITYEDGSKVIDYSNSIEVDFVEEYDSTQGKYVCNSFISDIVIKKTSKGFPVQIIGFNHDSVFDKETYGKDKAGITFMLGCTRGKYDIPPAVYTANIPYCSASFMDNHIVSPNCIDEYSQISTTGSNWSKSTFRSHLANHLNQYLPTEITDNLVTVKKINCNMFNAKNFHREIVITNDKYFLLSEYEMYGEQIVTKANEGDQYELFKTGESKVIMTPELYEASQGNATSTYTNSRLWFRSVDSKYTDPYIPSTSYYAPTEGYTANSSCKSNNISTRTNSLLMSYNRDTQKYNYLPGGASSNSIPAYIVPCFCM